MTDNVSRPPALRRALLVTAALSAMPIAAAHAQQVAANAVAGDGDSPTIIVTGTRKALTDRDSPTPIDVVTGDAVRRTGDVDLRSALETLVPSLAHQNSTQVGAGFKENFTLHGLSTNHLLVLVNGERRHTTANINTFAGPQQSATGVDMGLIPVSAIERIEVLRDGDSSQYGADAIAGVINVILKDNAHGGQLQGSIGQYYAGDGLSRSVSGNVGLKLGAAGFLNLNAEYSGRSHTRRVYLAGTPDQHNPAQNYTERGTVSYNAGYDLGSTVQVYSFGTYGHRYGEDILTARGPTSLPALFPNGYEPVETIREDDFSVTAGIKASDIAGWKADLSSTFGADYNQFDLTKSANLGYYASFGTTPTDFHVYGARSKQWSSTLDLSRGVDIGLAQPLNIALGAEERREYFAITPGDAASYYSSGSQGVAGLAPQNAINVDRNVVGAYLDLSTNPTPKWQVALSGRYEHYSDTGDTKVGRFTTRYDFSKSFALRGTIGTGFSAPSLAQQYFVNITTGPAAAIGLLSPASAAGQSVGAKPLKPERSTNYTAGFVWRPAPAFDLAVDLYQISIRDRIVTGGTAAGAQAAAALALAGFTVPASTPLSSVSASYLTNGARSRTRGIDITANYRLNLGSLGRLRWDLAVNLNDTKLTRIATRADGSSALNQQQIAWLTTATPKYKGILGVEWSLDRWSVGARNNLFGPTTDYATYYSGPNNRSTTVFERFRQGVKDTVDIWASFRPGARTTLTVGAKNVFNSYPDALPAANQLNGFKYDIYASQVGFYGGYYYATFSRAF